MKIYTKTGDEGTSSLYSGERRSKTDAAFAALGDVDELNSVIGVAREFVASRTETTSESNDLGMTSIDEQLQEIQSRLLDIGSAVATPISTSSESKIKRVSFSEHHADTLERWIDQHDATLPQLTNFILPSGGFAASHLHLARAVCRRAERSVLPLVSQKSTDAQVSIYLNRLSDYLFTIARVAAKQDCKPEIVYKKGE
jgi:ATP:cob(I)alamin adenosyltransferase